MTVGDLADQLNAIAPPSLAEPWDNVGLLAGDRAVPVNKVGFCIDLTPPVLAEAIDAGCGIIVAYHPPIFKPMKRLVGGVVFDAIRQNVAIYAPHTALDVAEGGTNDVLADLVGIGPVRSPLKLAEVPTWAKLVTFVPRENVDAVAEALWAAGCGGQGEYTRCSVRHDVVGTFRPGDAANPTLGEVGQDERVAETRLEVIVPPGGEADAVAALRRSHPYEEPAFDLFNRQPTHATGLGRRGDLAEPTTRGQLIADLKRKLNLPHVLVAGPIDGPAESAAVCAGSGGDLWQAAGGCDIYVTGELRHHDALAAAAAGLTVVCLLHSNSERPTLPHVARQLVGVETHQLTADRDPLSVV
jgi:dinuclear metal center YbgI/SA1388 family protein